MLVIYLVTNLLIIITTKEFIFSEELVQCKEVISVKELIIMMTCEYNYD